MIIKKIICKLRGHEYPLWEDQSLFSWWEPEDIPKSRCTCVHCGYFDTESHQQLVGLLMNLKYYSRWNSKNQFARR